MAVGFAVALLGCAADPDTSGQTNGAVAMAGGGGNPRGAAARSSGATGTSGMASAQAGAGINAGIAGGGGTVVMSAGSGGNGTSGGGAGTNGGSGAQGGSDSGGSGSEPCTDECPHDDGVEWLCKLRFMYGVNYAWHEFASDFGGNRQWNQTGVSANAAIEAELADMANNGVNLIRWWVWPDFRGDAVAFDAQDNPSGLGGTALADLARALELAEQHDLYLMLTLFSFDNFRLTRDESGIHIRGLTPIATDTAKRKLLIDNVVAPFARAAAQSPHASRLIAWDVINEPEWAITGDSMHGGDPPFDPMTNGFGPVSHAQMETFVKDVVAALRESSDALITVGGAAMKWRHAWSQVDVDFHQFHMYDWVHQYWPYTGSPQSYGVDDKPVVMGEFPAAGLTGADYGTVVESWFGNHYGGALSWAYTDGARGNLAPIKNFADLHPCKTRY